MYLTWQARLQQQPDLWDIQNWPSIDALSLPRDKRRTYLRNQQILSQVLAHTPLKDIETEYHFASGRITHFMNRCLAGDSEEVPPLTKALIPGNRIKPGQRQAPLATLSTKSGSCYSFEHLLETVPGLRVYLETMLKKASARARNGENLRTDTFHKAAIRFLRLVNWPSDHYPFTCKNNGYQGARRYLLRRWSELQIPNPPKRIVLPKARPLGAYEELEIDEHTVDAETGVVLELNQLWEPLRVSRISLIACRDVATNAVIARQIVLSNTVCASDMMMLFSQLFSGWQARDLCSPGLAWPPESFMPTQLGEAFLRATVGLIRLDNALVHLANDVRNHICTVLGSTLNLGIPRYPTARVLIESAFRDLNLTVHRVPSTTGSFPTDPLKEPSRHRKHAPKVSLKSLEEMIDVHIANQNTHRMGNLGAQSPIHVMRTQMAQHLVPLRPHWILGQEDPRELREAVRVRTEKGVHREPWINFLYVRYSNPGVLPAELVGNWIMIEYSIEAISSVRAYTLEGDYLGVLFAPKSWLRFEHGVVARKYIMNLVNSAKIKGDDPFGEYFHYLLTHRELPSCALEIIRFGRGMSTPTTIHSSPTVPSSIKSKSKQTHTKTPSHTDIPNWNTVMQEKRDEPHDE